MIELLQSLTKSEFVVYLVLKARIDEHPKKMGMTLMEISRLANVGVQEADMALDSLEHKGLIKILDKKITLEGHELSIPFTKQNTDSERLRKVEAECQRLRGLLATHQKSSGLGQIARDEDKAAIRKIEELFGRGVTTDEAFILGGLLADFGPQRVFGAVQNNIATNNPMRAAAGFLRGGAMGKKMNKAEEKEINSRIVSVDDLLD